MLDYLLGALNWALSRSGSYVGPRLPRSSGTFRSAWRRLCVYQANGEIEITDSSTLRNTSRKITTIRLHFDFSQSNRVISIGI